MRFVRWNVIAREGVALIYLVGGPTRTRTWDRRIMSPSQTTNHKTPQQPATGKRLNQDTFLLKVVIISREVIKPE